MKASIITAVTLLGSVALAQPHHAKKRHVHAGRHEKREIVWVTETDIVTEYLDITSTVWVDGDATSLPSSSDAKFYTVTAPTTEAAKPSTTLSSVFVAPAASSSSSSSVYVAPPAPSTSTSIYVAPTSTSVYVPPPVPTASTSAYVAPVVSTPEPTTTTPAAQVIAAAPTTTYVAPAATTTAAAATSSSESGSGSYSGTCSSASKCDGEITYYDTGMGACGWDNDGTTENVVALPAGLMGAQSNGNPYCGMTITISKGDKTTTAKVVDKCPGCSGNAIDLSRKAFLELADESVGRTEAEWWFN